MSQYRKTKSLFLILYFNLSKKKKVNGTLDTLYLQGYTDSRVLFFSFIDKYIEREDSTLI